MTSTAPTVLSSRSVSTTSMSLIDAATLIERLQSRAAHPREVEALQMARDALLTLVSEGYTQLHGRLHTGVPAVAVPADRSEALDSSAAERVSQTPLCGVSVEWKRRSVA
jgi:hypothetical protein